MFRLILTHGDHLPTKVFGGDYATLGEAEKNKRNVEKTTHYKCRIETLEPLNTEPEDSAPMLLNATHIKPESESYPDLPNQQRLSFPEGFPMPAAAAGAPQPTEKPQQQPVEQPTAVHPDGIGNSPLGDPYLNERDAVAMEQQSVTSEKIIDAYRWMGVITRNGRAEGNGHWQPCEGGDYNRITGHWREPDGSGGYTLYTIFELSVRVERMPSVHEARWMLFDPEKRRNYKDSRVWQDSPEKAKAAAELEEKVKPNPESNGKVPEPKEPKPEPEPEPEPAKASCSKYCKPGFVLPSSLQAALVMAEAAQEKLKTVRTQFGFASALHEFDLAVSDLCDEVRLVYQLADREQPPETKAISSEIPQSSAAVQKAVQESSTEAEPVESHQESPKFEEPAQTLPNATEGEIDHFELRETTLEDMGIAKGTCKKLRECNISTYGDIVEKIGAEQDWDILTDLPGIGIAKVDSIRGACEKLLEKVNADLAVQVLQEFGSLHFKKLAERVGYPANSAFWILRIAEKDSRFSVDGETISLA